MRVAADRRPASTTGQSETSPRRMAGRCLVSISRSEHLQIDGMEFGDLCRLRQVNPVEEGCAARSRLRSVRLAFATSSLNLSAVIPISRPRSSLPKAISGTPIFVPPVSTTAWFASTDTIVPICTPLMSRSPLPGLMSAAVAGVGAWGGRGRSPPFWACHCPELIR